MISINIIRTYRDVVALCDKELLGQKFEEEKFQLDVKESFYKGEEKSEEETVEILKTMAIEDSTFNVVGQNSIKAAIKAGIVSEESIGEIAGIPYALVLV